MKLRNRMLGGFTLLVLLPLLALALVLRREMAARLTAQDSARVETLVAVVEQDLSGLDRDLARRLAVLGSAFADDNRVRSCLLEGREELRPYVLDWAERALVMTGLDLLQVQDPSGRIVSSGHFRNEYDRVDAATPRGLAGRHGPTLVEARRPEGTFRAIARVDSVRLGEERYALVAGVEVDRSFLAALSPGGDLVVSLAWPGGAVSPDSALEARLAAGDLPDRRDAIVRGLELPALLPGSGEGSGRAQLLVTHSLASRRALLASLDRWLAVAWALAALGSLLLATRLSARISRPLEELARKTEGIDLDRLDVDFGEARDDEIGVLSRFLGRMTGRLRASVVRLREAERSATLGELARQVNHDLRNAFTPLRNVVRHLAQVADDEPESLRRVWGERHGTLESGLAYLESLAASWRRMARRPERVACDLREIARQVASGRLPEDGGPVRLALGGDVPPVRADPVGLRRIVENLVANACESLDSGRGTVEVVVERADADGPAVRLEVRDDGCGIPDGIRERIFDDFFTTKDAGTGLGLSVVRRLVSDFEGTVRVDSRPGGGTTFTVVLPAAAAAPEGTR